MDLVEVEALTPTLKSQRQARRAVIAVDFDMLMLLLFPVVVIVT